MDDITGVACVNCGAYSIPTIRCQNCGAFKPKNVQREHMHECKEEHALSKANGLAIWKPIKMVITLLSFGTMLMLAWTNPMIGNWWVFYVLAGLSIVMVCWLLAKDMLR